ncbi:polysaccharide lyase family 7 protein [Aquimarina gracilis]|uniref:Polysaccharide lyase family 7 protein n=1 Tax=Aquimarina gracilis TaxID=874422 RepID=A0ABU5ZVB8_9FLAO|nr:polysaccharide lyase family 7 protein [Aquimarina gracilis]MEB3345487.1 polysaccharide lyase family 7 protein [Aquimarina gracilis]
MQGKKTFLAIFILGFLMLLITACSSSEEEIIDRPIDSGETNPDVASPDQDTEQEQNFIWKNWYLSVPIDRGNGKATSIYYEAIENNTLTDDQLAYFYKNNDGSYTLYTKFTGYTTSGEYALDQKKYCRTELREYWRGNQTTSDNWSMTTGTHIMESTLKVNFCEGNKQTYVAQIHGIKNEALGLQNSPATVKVQWYDGDIVIEYYKKPESGEWTSQGDGKITIGKVDNEKFTIFLKIENGKLLYKLICGAKNIETAYVTVYDYVGNGYSYENYFKTGNYFKWDDDYTQSAEVILYSVKTTHD